MIVPFLFVAGILVYLWATPPDSHESAWKRFRGIRLAKHTRLHVTRQIDPTALIQTLKER